MIVPRPRSEMRRIREVLRLRAELGSNLSAIATGARLARSTVRAYLARAAAAGLEAGAEAGLSDAALEAALFPPAPAAAGRAVPDWSAIDQELRCHKHVTRKLLWLEYKTAHPDGFEFSQFKLRLSEWQKASGRGLSMRQVHHAGETVQVDYAGDTVSVVEGKTAHAAQIFVACLPCSGLIYAEASWTQSGEDWLASHVHLFRGQLGSIIQSGHHAHHSTGKLDLDHRCRRRRACDRGGRNGFGDNRNEAGCHGPVVRAGSPVRSLRAVRRQPNTCCEQTCQRRATSDTRAPGTRVSSTIRAFSSADQRRRRPGPVRTSTRRNSPFASSLTSNIRIARSPLPQANQALRGRPLNKGFRGPLTIYVSSTRHERPTGREYQRQPLSNSGA